MSDRTSHQQSSKDPYPFGLIGELLSFDEDDQEGIIEAPPMSTREFYLSMVIITAAIFLLRFIIWVFIV